jgi:Holliday junction DNA helicase RuvA
MIARLTGTIAGRGPDHLVVDVNGVGYLVFVPAGLVARALPDSSVTLYTHMVVREDSLTLYGFAEAHEERLFETLLGVSGVGPKAALALLSALSADELAGAIAAGNAAALARAPGVGKKLASRIVLELREKMGAAGAAPAAAGVESEEVAAALMALGYSQAEANEAVARADLETAGTLEEKVRLALGYFARARTGE